MTYATCDIGSNVEPITVRDNWAIPWTSDGCWDLGWLFGRISLIRSRMQKGDFIACGVPGSDLAVFLDSVPRLNPARIRAQHYESLETGGYYERSCESRCLTPRQYYEVKGGHADAYYQPETHMQGLLERWPEELAGAQAICTMADLFTAELISEPFESGKWKHDPNQANIQGLYTPEARAVLAKWGEHLPAVTLPWGFYDRDEVVVTTDGRIVIPAFHDTYAAGLTGMDADGGGLFLSSGTWNIVGKHLGNLPGVGPSKRTFRHLVFEGTPWAPTTGRNVDKASPVYRHLVKECLKLDFHQMEAVMRSHLGHVPLVDATELPEDIGEAMAYLREKVGGDGDDFYARAATSLVESTGVWSACIANVITDILGIPEDEEIKLGGGWWNNVIFREVLGRGFCVVPLPFGEIATFAGLFAEGLRRILKVPITEALQMIPR